MSAALPVDHCTNCPDDPENDLPDWCQKTNFEMIGTFGNPPSKTHRCSVFAFLNVYFTWVDRLWKLHIPESVSSASYEQPAFEALRPLANSSWHLRVAPGFLQDPVGYTVSHAGGVNNTSGPDAIVSFLGNYIDVLNQSCWKSQPVIYMAQGDSIIIYEGAGGGGSSAGRRGVALG